MAPPTDPRRDGTPRHDGVPRHDATRGADVTASTRAVRAVVEQRYEAALAAVRRLREANPEATDAQLADLAIRRCARDLAMGGAVAGGAAASPVAGATAAAATLGAEAVAGTGRLSEMVMTIGILSGFDHDDADERAVWVAAALGATESASVGITGLAARAGARGGARLLSRLPSTAATAAATSRMRRATRAMATKGGPWGMAALVPYGIGAGVGALGNAAMALSVGRAAKIYFATSGAAAGATSESGNPDADDGGIWDAEFISERVLDEEPDPG